jgi:hypothetical protein
MKGKSRQIAMLSAAIFMACAPAFGDIIDSKTAQSNAAKLANFNYKGGWNASLGTAPSNSPAALDYYIVTTAGTTSLGGNAQWNAGDWIIYLGGAWQRLDAKDPQSMLNQLVGSQNLTTFTANMGTQVGGIAKSSSFANIGTGNTTSGTPSYAFGAHNTSSGNYGFTAGTYNTASGNYSDAIGSRNYGTGTGASAIGNGNHADGTYSSAFGNASSATGTGSSAFGYGAKALANHATAIGDTVFANNLDSSSFGFHASASADGATALGFNAVGDVVNAVSVGATGTERKIVHLAAGSAATDAVNLSQVVPTSSTTLPSGITVTASPFVYHNVAAFDADVIVSGGTVTEIAFSRNGSTYYVSGLLAGVIQLSPGDYVKVTYSVAPTETLVPR